VTTTWVQSRIEQNSGLITLAAVLLGLIAKNSPLAPVYDLIHHSPVHVGVGVVAVSQPLIAWINDGLMTFFFLLVGLEIKRELVGGELAKPKAAILPAIGAAGGMAVPALIYLAFTWRDSIAIRGWAIPSATDTVLALTVLSLLRRRVPTGLKVFLTALAIFDDIGAVVIVGLFYGGGITSGPFALAVLAFVGLVLLNRNSVTETWPYVATGIVLWVAMQAAGIEAALSGVLIGVAIPIHASGTGSPLLRLERRLAPWVALAVVPSFAFFNAGVVIDWSAIGFLASSPSLGIILGLVLGKQLGIVAAAWAAVRLGMAELPHGVTWRQLHGAGVVAGIGFTLSLFVATIAFADPATVDGAKLAVLVASAVSGSLGYLVLRLAPKSAPRALGSPASSGPREA
jgi:NhaA family Na+:H+ antiporter